METGHSPTVIALLSLYLRRGVISGHSFARTEQGLWVASAPVFRVDVSDDAVLHEAIIMCVSASRSTIVTHPQREEFPRLLDPFVEITGMRTYAAFVKEAKSVQVEVTEDDVATFTPMRYVGGRGPYSSLEDLALRVPYPAGALSDAARTALAASE